VTQAINAAGSPQILRVTSTDVFHAEQAIRPVSFALAGFGVIVGLACIVLVGQALNRQVQSERASHDVARALGAGPSQIAAAIAVGPAVAVAAGALLAAVAAVLASPAMPIGPVRRVEAAAGIDVDWTVIGLDAVALVVVLAAVVAVVTWREAPARVQRRARLARPPRPPRAFGAAKLPPTAAMGLRFSLAPGTGSTAVPVRSVMASAAVAIAALTATVTFGASMAHLVSHPHLFGWNWDVALVDGAGYGNTNPPATEAAFAADGDIEAWGGAFYGADDVNGVNLPLLGMDPSSAVIPPIRDGRMIERTGEIVLGTATLAQLHVAIGDTVQTSSGPLRVVGSATLPTIGVVHGDHTSLGVGGLVAPQQVPGYDRNIAGGDPDVAAPTPAAAYGPNVLFVRFRTGADKKAAAVRLQGMADSIADYNGIVVTPVQRSAEIVNANDIGGAAAVLAGAVAVSALASLALALTAAVRRHRRDLALLKALGFTRRQISATIAWQATSTIAVGLLVGVPVGIVVGRLTWQLFARQLDVVAEPAVPLVAIMVIVVAAVVAANALAALPARSARAVPAALALRDE
jgi:putative ABC transport system permease protein